MATNSRRPPDLDATIHINPRDMTGTTLALARRSRPRRPRLGTRSDAKRRAAGRKLRYATAGPAGPAPRQVVTTLAVIVGATLVATSAAIHLHLWASGYRTIPTIGPLFLFQGIAGGALAVTLVAWRRLLVVAAAAGLMIATIGGLLLSVYVGLFGFMDTLSAPFAGLSLAVESAGTVVLVAVGAELVRGMAGSPPR